MRLRALCLVGSCMLLAANAVAEDDADRLLARIDAQIVATNYTAAADLLGEFLRDHYDSEKVSDALMTGWHLAYRMDRGKDGRGLVIEARVWGAKMPRWPAPGIPVPFVAAVVDCEGTSVRANLINVAPDPEHVSLGMKVRLATEVIGTDDNGTEAVGFGFEPLGG